MSKVPTSISFILGVLTFSHLWALGDDVWAVLEGVQAHPVRHRDREVFILTHGTAEDSDVCMSVLISVFDPFQADSNASATFTHTNPPKTCFWDMSDPIPACTLEEGAS